MKTGEAAKLLGIDPKTIINWIDRVEFTKYFSPTARKEGIKQRILTDNDFAVLNTIRHATTDGNTAWVDIAAIIDSGELERDIPTNAAFADTRTVPEPQVRESMRALQIAAERDQLALQVGNMQARIDDLEQKLQNEQSGRRDDIERLMREVIAAQASQSDDRDELVKKLAEAETMLRLYEAGRLKPKE
ncbi:MAG: hypothetical protein ABI700_20815 [Chloroflexota bacterium]